MKSQVTLYLYNEKIVLRVFQDGKPTEAELTEAQIAGLIKDGADIQYSLASAREGSG